MLFRRSERTQRESIGAIAPIPAPAPGLDGRSPNQIWQDHLANVELAGRKDGVVRPELARFLNERPEVFAGMAGIPLAQEVTTGNPGRAGYVGEVVSDVMVEHIAS